ncbi:sugar-transfer associated ATP-grasp domain-containing protein [Gelidibacter mesophilus]|uniref:sugar-transfer associated ATP-grasp domain-containing protein n=1 Tax=Gelidibacter mesophilus TaxID=169050 RepID=UPI00041915F7|nr:sugar-transfer associated ATP-grasp domain-containing protein [Gelidibacter mesophilus]
MKNKIKKIVEFLRFRYYYYDRTQAFEARNKNVNKVLFINRLDGDIIKKYKEKWSVLGLKVEHKTFILCYNLSGKIDYNIVPENIFAALIESKLNIYKELMFFDIKNIYEKWFDNKNFFPKSYFHKIDNIYYDSNMQIIEDIDAFLKNLKISFPIIVKPSKDTKGGAGVEMIKNFSGLLHGMKKNKHLVFQELILQNDYLNSINSGINSIRTCLYRTKAGVFEVLNNSIRFGIDGGLDNLTGNGIVCNIKEDGSLNEYAVNKYAVKYLEHPNSRVRFKDVVIPHFEELNKNAISIANHIPLCRLVSLDMCLDKNNNWRCIEINTQGQTILFAQYAGQGFFGKFTDEIIDLVKHKN